MMLTRTTFKIIDGKMLVKCVLNGKLPPIGANIYLKWGSNRSKAQNALLWAYYTWVIEYGGMKDQGFFCPEALHESLKAHFLADKIMDKGEWKAIEEGSTATLNKSEFSEYMEKIDHFLVDFFGIDTSVFWQDYEANKDNVSMEITDEGREWQARNL
jgi:hypothetical protein